jgi:hypothetical protein
MQFTARLELQIFICITPCFPVLYHPAGMRQYYQSSLVILSANRITKINYLNKTRKYNLKI